MESVYVARPAWVEIDLDCIGHNVKQFIQAAGSNTEIMAVVKADGYGHGAAAIARAALEAGASSLAVAFVEEGIDLRRNGIEAPILLLGFTNPVQYPALKEYRLTPTVFDYATACQLSEFSIQDHHKLSVHLKVDTGMGRVGLLPEVAVDEITAISKLPGLLMEGFFTHLAAAEDEDHSYTEEQLNLFDNLIRILKERGIQFEKIHAANSAASIAHPRSYYNLLRLGLAMYGYYPDPDLAGRSINLKPASTFKSRVVMVKQLPAGSAISYGCTYKTSGEEMIATVPVGYADGYSRLLSNRGSVLIRGCRAPVVGRVCMDHLMVNVSGIPGVKVNDEVVLYGRQGAEIMTVEEVAGQIGMVNYELLCAIDKRVSRLYYRTGRLTAIHDFIEDLTFD